MCLPFSCLVTQSRKVLWKFGIDSHDRLTSYFVNCEEVNLENCFRCCDVTVAPETNDFWNDDNCSVIVTGERSWFTNEHERLVIREYKKWRSLLLTIVSKDIVNSFKVPFEEFSQAVIAVDGLSDYQVSIVFIGHFDRALLGADAAAHALAHVNVPGVVPYLDLEIGRFAPDPDHFGHGHQVDQGVSGSFDKLRG